MIDLGGTDYSYVKTDKFSRTIHECCKSRSDDWSFTVIGRIEYDGDDLLAADCIYHHACSINFHNGKDLPVQIHGDDTVAKRKKGGRPKDVDQEQAFLKMCSYLEANNEEQLTISDLCDKMSEYLDHKDSVSYAAFCLKRKLQDH